MASRSRRRSRTTGGCFIIGCSLPIITLLILSGVYVVNNRAPDIVIPTATPPANNGYNDFLLAARMVKNISHKAPASMVNPPTTRAGLLAQTAACTKDAGPGLAVMRKGFSKACLSPSPRTYADLGFSDMAMFREIERTISGVQLYFSLTNQPLKAVDAALDGEEMAVMFPRGGSLIAALVGIACEAISLHRIEPLLPQLSKSELAHVASRLDTIAAKRVPWSEIMREEGRSSTAMLQDMLKDPKNRGFKANYEMVRTLMAGEEGKPPTLRETVDAVKFMFADKSAMLRQNLHYYEQLADESKGPFTAKSKVKVPDNMFTQMTGGLFEQGRAKWQASQTVVLLLRIEVALYRFKADHGVYPGALTQLPPTYLPSIPPDPFGGPAATPFHYALSPTSPGFLLYSIGSDMTDNGGAAGRYPDDNGFDMVAGKLGSRRAE